MFVSTLGRSVELMPENGTIDLSGLAEGMYLLQLTTTAGDVFLEKVIKQ